MTHEISELFTQAQTLAKLEALDAMPRKSGINTAEILEAALWKCKIARSAPPPAKRIPSRIPGPPPHHAVVCFDGKAYGTGYLTFNKDDLIMVLEPPPDISTEGWAYGSILNSGVVGWFPPSYVQ